MSRVNHLSLEIFSDVAGKPYVIITSGESGIEGLINPHTEIKIWADSLEVVDLRRKEK